MRKFNLDFKDYIDKEMGVKDVTIIDPPWQYDDKLDNRPNLTDYKLWNNNDLEYLFEKINSKYLFLWVTNSFLDFVFKTNTHNYKYKNIVTWIKTTNSGKYFYGIGHYYRNCTEHLLLFTTKNVKCWKSNLRNIIVSNQLSRTEKPKDFELSILEHAKNKHNLNNFTYIFSGLNVNVFENYNIDCVDIEL